MDKGKTCQACRKLNASINELGRCEPCQAKIEKHILKDQDARMKGESKRDLTILRNCERSKLGEDKGQ